MIDYFYTSEIIFISQAWNLILLKSTEYASTYALKKVQMCFKKMDI